MSHLSTNLALLRARGKLTAAVVAEAVGCKRSSYSGYENGAAEPSADNLLRIATYFKISVDRLLKQDLRTLGEFQMSTLERGYDQRAWMSKLHEMKPIAP